MNLLINNAMSNLMIKNNYSENKRQSNNKYKINLLKFRYNNSNYQINNYNCRMKVYIMIKLKKQK